MLSATFGDRGGRGQLFYLFREPHQVQGHFPWPWNIIYNPQNLLYLSGRSWFQFSMRGLSLNVSVYWTYAENQELKIIYHDFLPLPTYQGVVHLALWNSSSRNRVADSLLDSPVRTQEGRNAHFWEINISAKTVEFVIVKIFEYVQWMRNN